MIQSVIGYVKQRFCAIRCANWSIGIWNCQFLAMD